MSHIVAITRRLPTINEARAPSDWVCRWATHAHWEDAGHNELSVLDGVKEDYCSSRPENDSRL